MIARNRIVEKLRMSAMKEHFVFSPFPMIPWCDCNSNYSH